MKMQRQKEEDDEEEEEEEEQEQEDLVLFSDELDPAEVTLQAQRSLHKLRQRRDESMKQVKRETLIKLAAIKKRASAAKEASRKQRACQSKEVLVKMLDLLNERRETEALLNDIVERAVLVVNDYLELVIAGCKGRQAEAKRHLGKLEEAS